MYMCKRLLLKRMEGIKRWITIAGVAHKADSLSNGENIRLVFGKRNFAILAG
jgi:hypothetical protein